MPADFVEAALLKRPVRLQQLGRIRQAIETPLGTLDATIATTPEPVPFVDRLDLAYRPIRAGQSWGRAFTCAWFHVTGAIPAAARDQHVVAVLDTDGEALVLDAAGAVRGAISSRVTPIEQVGASRGKTVVDLTDDLAPDGRIDLWLDAGFNGKMVAPLGRARVKRLDLVAWRDDVADLFHDFLTCLCAEAVTTGALRKRYAAALDGAFRALGLRRPDDIAAARAELAPLLAGEPSGGVRVTAVGHGHLDLAWLWPLRETRRKAHRTFTHQLDLIDAHPDHVYGSSQPQQWAWLEDAHPEAYARLTAAVASGRLEPQGGLWVEMDANLPTGESLVRQALYGQRYFAERFGRTMDTCWLPDVFGYNANLPQLLSKAGMSSFMTIKLSWNEQTEFPHRSFVWEGIDGSRVLVHMPPEGTYNSSATPLSLQALVDRYPEQDAAPEALLVYGSGDGGGGPGRIHLELLRRSQTLEGFPAVEHGTARDFFARLEAYRDRLPVWRGELYLQKHQGTYTTQGRTKAGNRRTEVLLHDVEYLASLAWLAGRPWPRELLETSWKSLLLHQFHDILPGSSITRVHVEAEAEYARLRAVLDAAASEAVAALPGGDETVVANTQPVARRGHVRDDGTWFSYDVGAYATASLTPWRGEAPTVTAHAMANDRLSVAWDADGLITSLVDLASGREAAAAGLNRLVIHRDPWSYYDAWDINLSYLDDEPEVLVPHRVEALVDGPRAIRRAHYRHGRTELVQDAVLEPGQPYLRVETRVDWFERHRMLRAEFRPRAWADEVACEIQFGHFRRSTLDDTAERRAQFEVCAHRWVDVSTDGPDAHGFSLLNDSKYGHRAKDGLISLNLLRAPVYPDPRADRGHHEFAYALYPHEGGLLDADTIDLGYHLNAPVRLVRGRPAAAPFEVDVPGVLLETVKVAEDGDGLVLRLYESRGRAASGRLRTTLPVVGVAEVDLLERATGDADLDDLAFGPFEVRTLRVRVAR